ncbi:MAG: hypothetical protein R3A45_08035 [Bdellovibrionota bacterium]
MGDFLSINEPLRLWRISSGTDRIRCTVKRLFERIGSDIFEGIFAGLQSLGNSSPEMPAILNCCRYNFDPGLFIGFNRDVFLRGNSLMMFIKCWAGTQTIPCFR